MATITASLFFNSARKYKVGTLTFDIIVAESHNLSNTMTSYNIEDGSKISDHIENNKRTGSLSGLITSFSLNSEVLVGNRALEAFVTLEEIHNKKELVDVVTVLKVYRNMNINSISINRDSDTGEALTADISFEQANIVKLEQITVTATVKTSGVKTNNDRQSSRVTQKGRQTRVPAL